MREGGLGAGFGSADECPPPIFYKNGDPPLPRGPNRAMGVKGARMVAVEARSDSGRGEGRTEEVFDQVMLTWNIEIFWWWSVFLL